MNGESFLSQLETEVERRTGHGLAPGKTYPAGKPVGGVPRERPSGGSQRPSAEAIADVVADLREGRIKSPPQLKDDASLLALTQAVAMLGTETVVDASAVYEQLAAEQRELNLYDDHPTCAPPWTTGCICYRNQHGNVLVMAMVAKDRPAAERVQAWEPDPEDDKTIEWDRVRWTIEVPMFLGGASGDGRVLGTIGPAHMWRLAVYEDAQLADVRWIHLIQDYPMDLWDMAMWTLLGTLNFMGCRNVVLVDAPRSRQSRRRLERAGTPVTVQELGVMESTIKVTPTGRASRSAKGAGVPVAVPLGKVRGHFHHYGNCCPGRHEPKGLYFGRGEGRYWIRPRAVGSPDLGVRRQTYQLKPEPQRRN